MRYRPCEYVVMCFYKRLVVEGFYIGQVGVVSGGWWGESRCKSVGLFSRSLDACPEVKGN